MRCECTVGGLVSILPTVYRKVASNNEAQGKTAIMYRASWRATLSFSSGPKLANQSQTMFDIVCPTMAPLAADVLHRRRTALCTNTSALIVPLCLTVAGRVCFGAMYCAHYLLWSHSQDRQLGQARKCTLGNCIDVGFVELSGTR